MVFIFIDSFFKITPIYSGARGTQHINTTAPVTSILQHPLHQHYISGCEVILGSYFYKNVKFT